MGRTLGGSAVVTGGGAGGASGTPKVLFNGTLTSSNLTNNDEFTLFTNDEFTTSVVESVTVDASVTPALVDGTVVGSTLLSNGAVVGSFENSAGSEVVAPSTAFISKLSVPVVAGQGLYTAAGFQSSVIHSTNTVRSAAKTKDLTISGANYNATSTDDIIRKYFDPSHISPETTVLSKTVPGMATPRFYIEVGSYAYYFNYDGNSTTVFYSALITNGVVGAWQSIHSQSYTYKAIDIDNLLVRWVNGSGSWVSYDLTTRVETNQGGGPPGPSTFNSAGAVNGVVFSLPQNAYTSTIWYRNNNTNTTGSITLPNTFSFNAGMHLGAAYNPEENVYYLNIGGGSSAYTYKVAGNLSSASALAVNGSFYPNGFGSMYYTQGNANGQMFIKNAANQMEVIKFANDKAISEEIISNINGTTTPFGDSGWFKRKLGTTQSTPLAVEDFDINIRCKIDGTVYKEL